MRKQAMYFPSAMIEMPWPIGLLALGTKPAEFFDEPLDGPIMINQCQGWGLCPVHCTLQTLGALIPKPRVPNLDD